MKTLNIIVLFLLISCTPSEKEHDPNNWCGVITNITVGNPLPSCQSGILINILVDDNIVKTHCVDDSNYTIGGYYCSQTTRNN